MTRFSKGTQWLEPFLQDAKGLVPIQKLTEVKGFKVPLDKVQETEARCLTADHKTYVITIRTHDHVLESQKFFEATRWRPRLAYNVLVAFAHELAHMKVWDHTPDHWDLETRLCRRFIARLKRMQVKDITVRRAL